MSGVQAAVFGFHVKVKIRHASDSLPEPYPDRSRATDGKRRDSPRALRDGRVHVWTVDNGERVVTYASRTRSPLSAVPPSALRRAESRGGERIIVASCARGGDLLVSAESGAMMAEHLAASLRRGYWRIALRRCLMLRACGFDVPTPLVVRCEARRLDRLARSLTSNVSRFKCKTG